MNFDSQAGSRGGFFADYPEDVVKNEPMFFNCDLETAFKNGGDITKAFIDSLPLDWKICNPVLDSRVHMLMKNWYPCIPGWHHDDVPRSTSTGQPNYTDPEYFSEHLTGLVNAEICPTKFLLGDVTVSDPDIDKRIYNTWNDEIEEYLYDDYDCSRDLWTYYIKSGVYLQFDANTFHTGVKAKAPGWRWFVRLSRNTDRQKHMTNEIRRQVQVYLEEPMAGW
jgi:hypothetical protein